MFLDTEENLLVAKKQKTEQKHEITDDRVQLWQYTEMLDIITRCFISPGVF